MTVTINKKKTTRELKKEQQDKELSWLNSLRHILPPIEDEHENSIWSKEVVTASMQAISFNLGP